MDAVVVFFSQTGNTRKVVEVIADTFQVEGHSAKTIPLKDAAPGDLLNIDLLGFGTPCFSSKTPQPVMDFINAIPSMINQKVFVFATCSGAPGRVLLDMGNSLREKEANVIGEALFRGEVHHPAPSVSGRFTGRPNAEDLIQAESFARAVSAQITSDGSVTAPEKYTPLIKHRWDFYEILGSVISDSTLRFFTPEPKLVMGNCDQCGWCMQECPIQNIKMEPYPVLGRDCIRCYRCYNGCPSRAFTTNWRLSNPIIWLLYNQTFIRWFGDLKPGEKFYSQTINHACGA
jgi:flavodoxin/NAD-dependent dihydropyrimidine dehydrogenase PreA subunit